MQLEMQLRKNNKELITRECDNSNTNLLLTKKIHDLQQRYFELDLANSEEQKRVLEVERILEDSVSKEKYEKLAKAFKIYQNEQQLKITSYKNQIENLEDQIDRESDDDLEEIQKEYIVLQKENTKLRNTLNEAQGIIQNLVKEKQQRQPSNQNQLLKECVE